MGGVWRSRVRWRVEEQGEVESAVGLEQAGPLVAGGCGSCGSSV